MRFLVNDFRFATEILDHRSAWPELREELGAVTADEIVAEHIRLSNDRKSPPAGAQTALNGVIRVRLSARGWRGEPVLFAIGVDPGGHLGGWKMDFIKDSIGVEVSFNHAEAIPWTFTRLNLAGESTEVLKDSRINVGVAIFPTDGLKKWGRMDSAVGTFERASLWLAKMRPIMPIPIAVLGLEPANDGYWKDVDVFRGTQASRPAEAKPDAGDKLPL